MNQESQLPAFLYGESIFTTIKVVNGNAVDLSEHIDKLFLDAVGYFNVENLSTLERKLKNELKISDFIKITGNKHNNYSEIEKIVIELKEKNLRIVTLDENNKKTIINTSWLSSSRYTECLLHN